MKKSVIALLTITYIAVASFVAAKTFRDDDVGLEHSTSAGVEVVEDMNHLLKLTLADTKEIIEILKQRQKEKEG